MLAGVFGFTDRDWFFGAVILYGISALYTVFLWREGFRHHNRATYFLLLAGCALHTVAMLKRGLSLDRCPLHNLYEATAFSLWVIATAYLVVGLFGRLRFLGAFASPVLFAVGIFALMPALDKQHGPQPDFSLPLTSLHAALVLLSYGAFALAAIAAGIYLTQEHNLKFRKRDALLSLLPPIQRLELVMTCLLAVGFVLLSAGLSTGAHMPRPKGVTYIGDAKVLWSVAVWLLYLGLLVARWRFHQRGRRLAVALIGSFAFVLLTFWGTSLLSPLHNPVQ
jgi:HemX protein